MRRLISSGSTYESEIGYSRAVVDGDWIFVSGTTGFDYATMTISDDVAAQCRQAMRNIGFALESAGASFADVVRVHYVLPRRDDFAACWPVLREFLGEVRPAATMFQAELLDPRMGIEIEVTARRTVRAPLVEPVIDHIQITVRDMAVSVPFYDRLMPLLGFEPSARSSAVIAAHEFHVVEYLHPRLGFAITSPRGAFAAETVNRRKPGAVHHIAFRARSRAEVDRLHASLQAIGATIVEPPRVYPEYKPAPYYALFFKDPDGIKFEMVCAGEAAA